MGPLTSPDISRSLQADSVIKPIFVFNFLEFVTERSFDGKTTENAKFFIKFFVVKFPKIYSNLFHKFV